MTAFDTAQEDLRRKPQTWVVTGAAGFIGSNLVEALLRLDQPVIGLDDFSLGKRANLDELRIAVTATQWARFSFQEADIRDPEACSRACQGAEIVLHQAAQGSVPRSIEHPLAYHANNVTGHLNMLLAARAAGVRRFVYASSSAVYGDHPALPKREDEIGACLSPYATTKRIDELYAEMMARTYGLESVGLRYFNVFGPRQDPEGAYAAVIPRWIAAMLAGQPVYINGTGETSRDFCYVRNVVQANLLAALAPMDAVGQVYNVAVNRRTTLKELFALLRDRLAVDDPSLARLEPVYREFRRGDVLHSHADISKAEKRLGYRPTHDIEQGLDEALPWYRNNAGVPAKVSEA
jgi:UDP-N-acetylglucosamine/UDP-N-acetyl-alpha-D-glucosaminouronate 4-epimerase